ncbi:hypothetical protein NLX85_18310 [Micromonospora sp. A3M-1-15]|uniref:hypothetical protein n=1 Tax=Micromonospora sp. A3M-1-15 TaxID=2962035 RepID=UPI0020B766D5|nr:hypothetical protein [Micromonospora sp. A3M-1-15]MCP3785317.1 hypothetical protein [Micromonospora sp. A3M-1-15]
MLLKKPSTTRPTDALAPPADVRRIDTEPDARDLAHRVLTPGRRRWPVVVLTIPAGQQEPFGDPHEVKDAVGDLAEVVLMPTSDVSWAFSREMPQGTQVYGGAGRVYPLDHRWVADPARSRLRFAYSLQDRRRITDQLIHDALEAALAAGLLEPQTNPRLQQRSGAVQGVIGSRALVRLDDSSVATVWEELTVPGVALERLLVRGQRVTGVYDPVSRRLDLREALLFTDPSTASAAVAETYRIGDVVLADVAAVSDDAVSLRLLPDVVVDVGRDAVTSNANDTLRGLFTPGEIVACRIADDDPLRLRLDDVDDEETPKPAPSLLPGGPPWLCLPEPELQPPATPAARPTSPAPSPSPVPDPPPRRPTPLDMGPRGRVPVPRPVASPPMDGAPGSADGPPVIQLRNELAAERATREALAGDLAGLRGRAADLENELAHANHVIEQLQTRYRSADLARQRAVKQLRSAQGRNENALGIDAPAFLDAEDQFRFEVYSEWVRRIPPAEKASKPLADYLLGPGFLESVEQLAGISRAKIVAVVVEVLTAQVQHLAGRGVHQLRAGGAGGPYVRRADGATCWRVALQQDAPAARRLHYWRTPDGYELSRVAVHDDYRP